MAAYRGNKRTFNFVVDNDRVTFDQAKGAVLILETYNFDGWVGFDFLSCFNVVVRRQFEVKCAGVRFKS